MPDSSVVLSKRNKSYFKASQMVVFPLLFLVISVIGIFSYNYFLEKNIKTNSNLEVKLAENTKPKQNNTNNTNTQKPPVGSTNSNKPKDVFLGLASLTSTGFVNTINSPINLLTGLKVVDNNKNNLKIRPWAVMIKNKPQDRPQVAISEADIVYEAVDELGTTSLLGIFYENRPEEIGPIANLKYYFANFALDYSPFLIFTSGPESSVDKPNLVDKDVDVYRFIGSYGLYSISQDKNGAEVFSNVVSGTQPQSYLNIGKLYSYLGKVYGSYLWVDSNNYTSWNFKEDQPNPVVKEFSFNFWDLTDYEVKWVYNQGQNNYLRNQGGSAFTDKKNGKQVKAKNVILIFAKETQTSDAYSNLKYNLIGEGDAYFYLDGKHIKGTWKKTTVKSQLKFYDSNKEEMKFNRGNTWIEMLPFKSKIKVVNSTN